MNRYGDLVFAEVAVPTGTVPQHPLVRATVLIGLVLLGGLRADVPDATRHERAFVYTGIRKVPTAAGHPSRPRA